MHTIRWDRSVWFCLTKNVAGYLLAAIDITWFCTEGKRPCDDLQAVRFNIAGSKHQRSLEFHLIKVVDKKCNRRFRIVGVFVAYDFIDSARDYDDRWLLLFHILKAFKNFAGSIISDSLNHRDNHGLHAVLLNGITLGKPAQAQSNKSLISIHSSTTWTTHSRLLNVT